MTCCRLLTDGVMQALPFQRTIATAFYDGPIDGFTECSECRTTYSFRKLDWDDSQDVRVTGFAPLQSNLDDIAIRLEINRVEGGRLSLIPPLNNSLEQIVKDLFSHRPLYIAAISNGWPGGSAVWRDLRGFDLQDITDWFWFLGIPRGKTQE